jgi:GAF domain-containing protein
LAQGPGTAIRRARGAALAPQTPAVQSGVPRPVSGTPLISRSGTIRCRFMEVNLCVLLWAHEGRETDLSAHEDQVLGLLAEHDGHVIQRARTVTGKGDDSEPTEVQFLRFASETALDGYMHDDRRAALADQRDAAIAMTEVLRVKLL